MRLTTYEAHNVKKISDISFDMKGHHLFLVGGRNAHGKTSVLEGVLMALAGRKGFTFPDNPLREGEKAGWVKIGIVPDDDDGDELGPLTVELHFKRKRDKQVAETLRVTGADGVEIKKPRDLLSRLYKLGAFDPLAFGRMSEKEQRVLMLELVGVDPSQYTLRIEAKFSERTVVNREVKRLSSVMDELPHYPDAPAKEVSVSGLQAEREDLEEENAKIEDLRNDIAASASTISSKRSEAYRLEGMIKEAQAALELIEKDIAGIEIDKAKREAELAASERNDLSEIDAEIRGAAETNEQIRRNAERVITSRALAKSEAESNELTAAMDAIKEERDTALGEASWPVEGLSFDDEQIIYRGLPLSAASKAERTMVSFEIGAALNPELKLFVCEDGNDLDPDTIVALEKMLTEKGYQAIVEYVTRSEHDEGLCAVVIEDGKAKGGAA